MIWFAILTLVIPFGLDLYVPVPEENPITDENIELGRRLFNDRRLSNDQTVACSSCHDASRAFAGRETRARGVFGREGRRNAPALINRAWGKSFSWDGRAATLEEQVLRPIEDPKEMDLSIDRAAARVGRSPTTIARALATYVRSIMSGNAAYDRYAGGDIAALTSGAQLGLQLFRGKGNCTACHTGPTFTDEQFHNTGIAWDAAGSFLDEGRAAVTGRDVDRGAFKTPTLREIEHSAPYMHDGSIRTLEDVIEYYDRGGNWNPHLDPEVRRLGLTALEKRALVEFLHSLTGETRR
jgi:cytochrome c peroxidase